MFFIYADVMQQHPGFRFPKEERLNSRKAIDRLFKSGKAFLTFPVRVQFLLQDPEDAIPAKALFSVPRRRFKKAVTRNLLKRRMREAYRLNKRPLTDVLKSGNIQMNVAFIFIAPLEADYSTIEKGMKKAISRLIAEIEKHGNSRENI
ncbi:MAG: ribonuclease P protein component [Marinilabilia sp.]